MSHISTVKVTVRKPVRRIVERCFRHLEGYRHQISETDLVLVKKGLEHYPISVLVTEDGIELKGDSDVGLPGLQRDLHQAYVAEASREALTKQGYSVSVRRVNENLVLVGAQ